MNTKTATNRLRKMQAEFGDTVSFDRCNEIFFAAGDVCEKAYHTASANGSIASAEMASVADLAQAVKLAARAESEYVAQRRASALPAKAAQSGFYDEIRIHGCGFGVGR